MAKYKILFAGFPFGGSMHPDVSDWLAETILWCSQDARIGPENIIPWRIDSTPITGSRNACLVKAEQSGVDFVCMIDSDMNPDYESFMNPRPANAKRFFESSLNFMLDHDGPCIVAAPYCGPPPTEMPYYFKFEDNETGLAKPNCGMRLEAFTRSEAALHTGMVRCAALPTGLMLIDMRVIRKMPHPRFYYEWKDDGARCKDCGTPKAGPQHTRASTEDVTFTRDVTYAGFPIYANCDAWAGHHKSKCVLKPMPMHADAVPRWMIDRAKELALQEIAAEQCNRLIGRDHAGSSSDLIQQAVDGAAPEHSHSREAVIRDFLKVGV